MKKNKHRKIIHGQKYFKSSMDLPLELRDAMVAHCRREGLSQKGFIAKLVEQYLKNYKENSGNL